MACGSNLMAPPPSVWVLFNWSRVVAREGVKTMKSIILSVLFFVLAGLFEIGGGYLMWQWLREGRAIVLGALGAMLLVAYGVVPTLQPAHFGRVYAAYGGVFVVMSLLWGWGFDGNRPDRWDLIGGGLCVIGVAVMMYTPRSVNP